MPGQVPTQLVVPGQVPQAVPGQVPQAVPGQVPTQLAVPGQVPQAVPGQVPQAVPGQVPTQLAVPGQVPQAVPGQVPQAVPGQVPTQTVLVLPRPLPIQPTRFPTGAGQTPNIPTGVPTVGQPGQVTVSRPAVATVVVPPMVPMLVPQIVPQARPQVLPQRVPAAIPEIVHRPKTRPEGIGRDLITATPGRQPSHNAPAFKGKTQAETWNCLASGHGRRKSVENGAVVSSGALNHVGAVDVLGRDLPALHPRHSHCIVSVKRRKRQ